MLKKDFVRSNLGKTIHLMPVLTDKAQGGNEGLYVSHPIIVGYLLVFFVF